MNIDGWLWYEPKKQLLMKGRMGNCDYYWEKYWKGIKGI